VNSLDSCGCGPIAFHPHLPFRLALKHSRIQGNRVGKAAGAGVRIDAFGKRRVLDGLP